LRGYLYTGSVAKGGIMIIGDDPSDKSIGSGYIKGFLSDKGSSSLLHQCLYEAGVYEHTMPYFTNWGKGFDNDADRMRVLKEEIDTIQPRKIITLGKEVTAKTGIGGGELEHPSYVKRFSSNNYEWYIKKIKELIK
jgi:uracil-DNA glycosylase